MDHHVHLPDREAAEEAADLIVRYGDHAAREAYSRADRSRDAGNVRHYCRWRQVERLITLLGQDRGQSTIH